MNSGNESQNVKSSSNREVIDPLEDEDPLRKKVKVRCGECSGCRPGGRARAKNCQKCPACLDMPKYGGPGNLRLACR